MGGVVELDKEVAAEHGLGHHLHALVAQFLHLHGGQEAGEALVLQVLEGPALLPRLGVDDVPSGVVWLCHLFKKMVIQPKLKSPWRTG